MSAHIGPNSERPRLYLYILDATSSEVLRNFRGIFCNEEALRFLSASCGGLLDKGLQE